MDDNKTRLDLMERFPGIDEAALIKCKDLTNALVTPRFTTRYYLGVAMCRMFDLTPETLRYKWEALMFNSSGKDTPIIFFTLDSAMDLQQMLQREIAKPSQQKTSVPKPNAGKKVFRQAALGGSAIVGPPAARKRQGTVKLEPSMPTGPPANFTPPYNTELYNCGSHSTFYCLHDTHRQKIDTCTRKYMTVPQVSTVWFMSWLILSSIISVLDDQIDDMAELVKTHYQLEELGDPSVVTQVRSPSSLSS
jgi:DNA polymerase alpha subunit B